MNIANESSRLEILEKELSELLKQSRRFYANLRNAKTSDKRGKWYAELNQVNFSIEMTKNRIREIKDNLK